MDPLQEQKQNPRKGVQYTQLGIRQTKRLK
jgi:hypothetical protein